MRGCACDEKTILIRIIHAGYYIKLWISNLTIALAFNCVTDRLFNMIRLRYALQVKKIQWRFASGRQGVDCRLRAGQWIFVELFET